MTFYWSIFDFACNMHKALAGGGVCVTLLPWSVVAGLYKIFISMRKYIFVAGMIAILASAGAVSAQSVTSEDLQRQLN